MPQQVLLKADLQYDENVQMLANNPKAPEPAKVDKFLKENKEYLRESDSESNEISSASDQKSPQVDWNQYQPKDVNASPEGSSESEEEESESEPEQDQEERRNLASFHQSSPIYHDTTTNSQPSSNVNSLHPPLSYNLKPLPEAIQEEPESIQYDAIQHLLPGGSPIQDQYLQNNNSPNKDSSHLSSSYNSSDYSGSLSKSPGSGTVQSPGQSDMFSYSQSEMQSSNGLGKVAAAYAPMQAFDYQPLQPVFIGTEIAHQEKQDQALGELFTPSFKEPALQQPSLADAFRQKKKEATVPTRSRRTNSKEKDPERVYAGGRTKEEILAQRREMMKPRTKPKKKSTSPEKYHPQQDLMD